jgi:hypothetical protein
MTEQRKNETPGVQRMLVTVGFCVARNWVISSFLAGLFTGNARADLLDLSRITSVTNLPITVSWKADDGSVGNVDVSLRSAPSSGKPITTGSLEMGLSGATVSSTAPETAWFVRLAFDRPVTLEINNAETLTWYERTHLITDGSPWTGGFSTNAVPGEPGNPATGIAEGLGTQSLTLYRTSIAGTNGYPYGLFESESLITLDIGYGVIVDNGVDGNVVQIRVLSSKSAEASAGFCVTAPAGLIGWWPGDGKANDLTGGDNGVMTDISFAPGLVGQAFRFIGSKALAVDSFVRVPNQPAFSSLTNVTLECWVWNDASKPFGRVLTLTPDWVLLGLDANSQPGFTVNLMNGQSVSVATTFPLTPATWHHLVGTFDGKTARVYVDGTLQGSTDTSGTMANQGAAPEVYLNFFGSEAQGLIDEVAVYSRALSLGEVQSHFNAGAAGMCKETALTGFAVFFPGTARIELRGPPAKVLTLQSSTNLLNWSVLTTLTGFTGTGQYSDTNAGAFPRRFYRAKTE